MPATSKKISLVYFFSITLLLVGLVPLVLTGWFLSERSAVELRAVEGRYQTQLVQDKARQIEMFGQRYNEMVKGIAKAFELTQDFSSLSSEQTQQKLGQTLKENPFLVTLYVKPISGDPLSVFRAEWINEGEVEALSQNLLGKINDKKLIWGRPQVLASSGEGVITIAAPVVEGQNISAAVIAVISLREIGRIMADAKPATEKELWESGLPIIFVVNEMGNPIFHPDLEVVKSQKSLNDLRIVQEWKESSKQIQSALVPFKAVYNNVEHEMIGAYSTASFSDDITLGVVTMQDENRALASVSDMRRNTWLISLAFAFFALLVGSLLARQLTHPVSNLVSAAEQIGLGDLTARISPNIITEFNTLGSTFNSMSENLEEHIAKLAKAAQENRELFVGTVKALAAAIDGKDRYTRGHSERVARFSVAMGKRLGLPEDELEKLRISALLHDVGKIAIDDNILKKPSALTDEEFEIMKTHPQKGYKIMSQIPAMQDFLAGMYMHHEMVNGQGYPQGLKGDEIPLQGKIVSVADTFDAMTTDRPYQKGMDLDAALDRIRSFVGTRYDGKVVEALVLACNEGQIRPVGAVHPRAAEKDKDESQDIPDPMIAAASLSKPFQNQGASHN